MAADREPSRPPVRLTARGRAVTLLATGTVLAAVAFSVLGGDPVTVAGATGAGESQTSSVSTPAVDDPATPTSEEATVAAALTDDPGTTADGPSSAPVPVVVNGREQPPRVDPPASASGQLVVVPGSTPPVSGPRVWTYRVEVEDGLPFDGATFAKAVHTTLSDPRGWAADGNVFQRVDADADMRIVLASPTLTDQLCAPLRTLGEVSCRNGDLVVINARRWGTGIEDYGGDLASYREYVVNHEVGHRLGRGHVECPGAGEPAPVMMQQTYGLDGCAPNAWPLLGE